MDLFHRELLRFGSIVGLQHYNFYLRGREELMAKIRLENKNKEIIEELYMITLYFKKGTPLVYKLVPRIKDGVEDIEEEHDQVEQKLQSVEGWKKRQTRLRSILVDLLLTRAEFYHVGVENPFAVDRNYFILLANEEGIDSENAFVSSTFPLASSVLDTTDLPKERRRLQAAYMSGALLRFIGDLLCVFPHYTERIALDIQFLSDLHFFSVQKAGLF